MRLFAILCLTLLAGCQDQFRYPCMDRKNWDKQFCQRPDCAITQTCPDQLIKPDELKGEVR